jgi:glucose/arabinose dehydrogenase
MPEQAMPAFAEALTEKEAADLVNYILRQREEAENQPAVEIPRVDGEVFESKHHKFRVEELTDQLEIPWALAFLPDGRMLVTDMVGELRVLRDGNLLEEPVSGLPPTPPYVEGGLMDVAVPPDYAETGWIYLAYAHALENGQVMTRVIRGKLDAENRWSGTEAIWEVPEEFYSSAGSHFGVRILFHRGYLFLCIGDRHDRWNAQDLSDPRGKTHRLMPDGNTPADNPFVEDPGAYQTIWTWGHRNPQGLNVDPRTGEIYLVEHGPYGGDEVNRLVAGGNYGWPEVTHGREYSGAMITPDTERPGMESPLTHWTPSIAPGGSAFAPGGASFPDWRGDLFVSSLVEGNLRRLRFSLEGELLEEEIVVDNLRRTREVAVGPNGFIYVTAERPGRVLRLVPVLE